MSGSNCPRPRYGQCEFQVLSVDHRNEINTNHIISFTDKCGSSFQGTIMSVHSSERGLFYALDSMMDDNFYKIDEHRPEVEFKKPEEIKFGDPFIFFDQIRNSYSRAYRLNSSPANKLAIRAFLFDIGVEVYQNFTKGQYFKFPNDFKLIPPMALFCVIDSFPAREDVEIKSEFLENSVFRRMKFNVKREMKINNSLGSNQLCLMVDVENVEELKEDSEALDQFTWHNQNKQESLEKEEKFASDLSFMDGSGDEHVPFPADFVLQDSYLPEPGAKILIYRTEVLNPWSLYARYNIEENLTNDYFPESLSVELLMNDDDVVESYENLCGEPVVGEMVITMGRDHRYHRGLVEEIAGDSYIVSVKKMSHESNTSVIIRTFTDFLRRLRLHAACRI